LEVVILRGNRIRGLMLCSQDFQILEKKKMRRKRWQQAYLDAGEEDEGEETQQHERDFGEGC